MSDAVSGRKGPGVGSRQNNSMHESVVNENTDVPTVNMSHEYFGYTCDPCESAGDQTEAQGFCTDCEEYLCETCFRSHSRSKVSKNHTLLDKDAMLKMSVKYCEPCKSAGEDIEAVGYCSDCMEYLCSNCYKSHSRSKSSRHHVLTDKVKLSEKYDRATAVFAKMSITSNQKFNEEYTYIRDINVKAEADEKDCFIVAMSLVSETELVLADANNNSLKVVDIEKCSIKDILKLQAVPCGITVVSKDMVAVSLDNKYQILIVSVVGKLSVVRTIKTSGNCLGVTCFNGQLLASFRGPVQFQTLQLTGAINKTIQPDSEVLKDCTHPLHIAVSPDESLIYVSDWKTNKVFSMNMEGKMVSLYKGELKNPYAIAISPFGSIYLCNRGQHVVYKMTPDLTEATVIVGPGDGVSFPHAMCKEPLFISSGSSDPKYKNCLKLFKLV